MRTLSVIAVLLLASSAAQAQYTFEFGGRTIRIDPDRGTVSIPGVYDNTGRHSRKARVDPGSEKSGTTVPAQAKADPQAPPDAASPQAEPPTATAKTSPAETPAAQPSPAPQDQQETAPPAKAALTAPPPPASAVVPPQAPAAAAAAPTHDPSSPVGVWFTEEKEGKIRIEPCGADLCGYSVDGKSNRNGEQILINMKPGRDQKWSGRIFDPTSGSTYDSTIALRGPDSLRVQGCAFGGMFCGGQTWTRVN